MMTVHTKSQYIRLINAQRILKSYLVKRLQGEKGGVVTIRLKSIRNKYGLERRDINKIRDILEMWAVEAYKSGSGRKLRGGVYSFRISWLREKLEEL